MKIASLLRLTCERTITYSEAMNTPITPAPPGPEMEITQKIERYIAAKGVKRSAIHAAAGISRPTFNAKMADGGRFTVNELLRISAHLGIQVYELLPGELTGANREAA